MASECEHSLIGAVPPLKTITKSPSVHCVQDHDEPARPLFLDNPRALRACHLHRDANVCSTRQWSWTRFAGWLCLDRTRADLDGETATEMVDDVASKGDFPASSVDFTG